MGSKVMKYVNVDKNNIYHIDDIHIMLYKNKTKSSSLTLIFESKMRKEFRKIIDEALCDDKKITLYYYDDIVHCVEIEYMPNCPTSYSSSYASLDSIGDYVYVDNVDNLDR